MRVFWPQIMENAEISNVVKIMGLQFNKKYSSEDELKTLRYGKMMIMTDQVTQTCFVIYRLFIIVWLGLKKSCVSGNPTLPISTGRHWTFFTKMPIFFVGILNIEVSIL